MKKYIPYLLLTTSFVSGFSLIGNQCTNPEQEFQIIRQQPCPQSCQQLWCDTCPPEEIECIEAPPCNLPGHWSVTGGYVSVAPADFRTSDVEDEDIAYREGYVNLSYTYDLSTYHGWTLGVGYVHSTVDWAENPFFDQEEFGYVSANIGGFLKCPECWFWKATIGASFDTQEFNPASYTLYQGMLWGRYAVTEPFGLNFGFLAEVGLNKGKVWPLFGIDYRINPCWRLNIIYPVDMSLEYRFHPKWATGLSARFLRSRHRVSEDQPLPKAIYEYRTTGVEWDIIFKPFEWLSAEAFAGYTLGGDFKVTNRYNHDAQHFKFNPSFYSGINAILEF